MITRKRDNKSTTSVAIKKEQRLVHLAALNERMLSLQSWKTTLPPPTFGIQTFLA
jgi:hypothetical protein